MFAFSIKIIYFQKETKNDKGGSKKTNQKSGTDNKMLTEEKKKGEKNETKNEMPLEEYYVKKHYNSVLESLALFKDDPLVHKPGESATFLNMFTQ